MKDVIISIRPEWMRKIISGEKTVELRKTRPKIGTPFRVYTYQCLPKHGDWNEMDGRIVGEFICNQIYDCGVDSNGLFELSTFKRLPGCCLNWKEICSYAGIAPVIKKGMYIPNLYGWEISDFKTYVRPRKLSEYGLTRPPQSWMYLKA